MAYSDWSTNPAANATQPGINFAEGQLPGSVNDSMRQVLADLATFFANFGAIIPPYSSLAAIAAGTYSVGQTIRSSLYDGSTWVCRASVQLQNDGSGGATQSSIVNFNDELHQQVTLSSGGTGVMECQPGSIAGYIRRRYAELYTVLFAKIGETASLGAGQTAVGCYGDSITFGQVGAGYAGAVATSGTATNFGDGSTYAFNQHPAAWPAVLTGLFNSLFGAGKIGTINRGYSGDRIGSAYVRHRIGAGSTASILFYGTNDQLFATSNGVDQTGLFISAAGYSLDRFVPAYRKFAYREVLRGSVPVFVTPYAHNSLSGFDGTTWASARLLSYYRNAIHALAEEVGAEVVDANDIAGMYPNSTATTDGIHPDTYLHYALAARLAPLFMGHGWRDKTGVAGTRKLNVMLATDNINGLNGGANGFEFTDNTNSLGKAWAQPGHGADVNVGSEPRYFAIYCADDETAVMPIGYISGAGSATIQIDFNAQAGGIKLDARRTTTLGAFPTYPTNKTVTNASGTLLVNYPGVASGGWPVFPGKGWHSVTISGASFVMSGLLVGRFGDVGTAIADVTGGSVIDVQARAALQSILGIMRDRSLVAS